MPELIKNLIFQYFVAQFPFILNLSIILRQIVVIKNTVFCELYTVLCVFKISSNCRRLLEITQ